MIKGVNRQVIEITQTKCEYFEKVLFFVKPEYSCESDGKLKGGALKSIRNSAEIPKTKRQKVKSRMIFIVEMAASAGAGAILTAILIR